MKAQLRPGQPLVGVGQAQVGEDVAGAFLVLDAPCPSPPASYSPLPLRYLRWLLFKTYLHSTRSAGAGLRIARSSRQSHELLRRHAEQRPGHASVPPTTAAGSSRRVGQCQPVGRQASRISQRSQSAHDCLPCPGWRRVSVVRCQWSVARSDGRRPLATNHRRAIGGILQRTTLSRLAPGVSGPLSVVRCTKRRTTPSGYQPPPRDRRHFATDN
jgi:hypothetical protein